MVMHLRQLRPRLAISVACWAREKISSHMSSAIDQNRLKLSGDVWFIDVIFRQIHIPMVSLLVGGLEHEFYLSMYGE